MKFEKFRLILFGVILVLASSSQALADDIKVHFAGFAFRGDFAHIQKNFPHAFEISKDVLPDQRGALDAALVDRVKNLKIKNGEIVTGELARLGDGSLTLACCLDTELVSIEEYDDGYKIVIDLGAQALLFDYDQMRLVASFPIMVELVDFMQEKPDELTIRERVRDLLLTSKYGINLFDDFVSILSQVEFKRSYGSAIKVTNVVIEEKAIAELSETYSEDIDNFKTFVAQNFGKYLSKNQSVSILPYSKGSDIGNKMAVRFINSKVFELAIPEPQFAAEITVRGFKKVCTEEKSAGSCWVYGSYTNIKISQQALGKVYLDEKVKFAVSKIIPSSQKSVQDWPSFQNSLIGLFNEMTRQFSEDRKYKDIRKVLDKCS
jgi:hypothetical protein